MRGVKHRRETWRDEFVLTGQNPAAWQLLARSHLSAANMLLNWGAHRHGDTFFGVRVVPDLRMMPIYLLLGYALENLVKGLLVARGHNATWVSPLETKRRASLDSEFRHHCLPDLFRLAEVKTSAEERHLLEDLRDAIESEKYPVGVKPRSRKRTLGTNPISEIQSAFELFRRMEESLRNICPDGVLSPCDPAGLGLATGHHG